MFPEELPVKSDLFDHLRHAWPLTLAALLLTIYLPIVLLTGTFYSNQGSIKKDGDPERYWSWVRRCFVLLLVSWSVLIASYQLK